MAAFFLADIEVLDEDLYQEYVRQAASVISAYGGKYVIRSSEVAPFSGDWRPDRILVVRFPDRAALDACFGSPDYQTIRHLREQSTRSRAVVIEY